MAAASWSKTQREGKSELIPTNETFMRATVACISRAARQVSIGCRRLAAGSQQLHRVNRAVLTLGRPLPVYPGKQTISEPVGASQKCHLRTDAPQQIDPLFDHLVRAAEQRRRVSIPSALAVQRPTSVAAPTTP